MKNTQLIDSFQKARKDTNLAIIEGIQALKHAVIFGAVIHLYITCDILLLKNLLSELSDDAVRQKILSNIIEVDENTFKQLSTHPPRTKVIALADVQKWHFNDIDSTKPVVFLEDPKDLENIGAVIRVSAASDIGAVITDTQVSVWHPAVIRGGAGLQYAIPVLNTNLEETKRFLPKKKLLALDPTGTKINKSTDLDGILIFGTERYGIRPETLNISDEILRIPMRKGVSSLNLATSVSAVLYQNMLS